MSEAKALKWKRADGPERVYTAGEFQIIYDSTGPVEGSPGGWYVWRGTLQLGMRFKLSDAKALAETSR